MLRGDKVVLRARQPADVPVLHADLHEDVETRSRSDSRPWRPIPVETPDGPFSINDVPDTAAVFSIVALDSDEIAGSAQLWGIDQHNRSGHLGLSLRPSFRGRGLGTDVVRVLIRYGFRTRGLHRLSLETLADNDAMRHAATNAGFVHEGTLRAVSWIDGQFVDEIVFGLLAAEYAAQNLDSGSI
jgi:RimJ/RimL family protein N-acetyltransferase